MQCVTWSKLVLWLTWHISVLHVTGASIAEFIFLDQSRWFFLQKLFRMSLCGFYRVILPHDTGDHFREKQGSTTKKFFFVEVNKFGKKILLLNLAFPLFDWKWSAVSWSIITWQTLCNDIWKSFWKKNQRIWSRNPKVHLPLSIRGTCSIVNHINVLCRMCLVCFKWGHVCLFSHINCLCCHIDWTCAKH